MNFMLEALGRDIGVMWNRFVWHPTIAQMQADMLREVWSRRPRWRLLNSPYDAQREIDRIIRIWLPTTKRVLEELDKRGPFGTKTIFKTREQARTDWENGK